MKKLFIYLVTATLILYVLWFAMPFFWHVLYDNEIVNLLSWGGYRGYLNVSGPIPYITGIVYVIALIGLLLFKKWARLLFVISLGFSVVTTPLWGMSVETGYEALIGYLMTLCDGVILAVCYLTSLNDDFK